jgi:hypothetical protein
MEIVGNLKLCNGAKMLIRELPAGGYSLELTDAPGTQIAIGDDPNKLGSFAWKHCAWEVRFDCDLSKVAS